MTSEAKVIPFPDPDKRVTCRLCIRQFGEVIGSAKDVPSGLAAVAEEMRLVAEHFETLAELFEDCDGASYSPHTCYMDGLLIFEFYVPRRFLGRIKELGWTPEEEAK